VPDGSAVVGVSVAESVGLGSLVGSDDWLVDGLATGVEPFPSSFSCETTAMATITAAVPATAPPTA
jgi:hypothetical protein